SDELELFIEKVTDIYVPTVFSPNGDGINDVITVYGSAEVQSISSIRYYDRWGGLLSEIRHFPPNDPAYGWDGTVNGKSANEGVYVWIAEVERKDGKTQVFSGNVTLLR
ncbi:MAG: T9SS type B sorting domain-containing protein, partial [Saprospiraceae bacterium]